MLFLSSISCPLLPELNRNGISFSLGLFPNSVQVQTYTKSLFSQLTSDAAAGKQFGVGIPAWNSVAKDITTCQEQFAEQETKRILQTFLHDSIYLLDLFLNHWCFQVLPSELPHLLPSLSI